MKKQPENRRRRFDCAVDGGIKRRRRVPEAVAPAALLLQSRELLHSVLSPSRNCKTIYRKSSRLKREKQERENNWKWIGEWLQRNGGGWEGSLIEKILRLHDSIGSFTVSYHFHSISFNNFFFCFFSLGDTKSENCENFGHGRRKSSVVLRVVWGFVLV